MTTTHIQFTDATETAIASVFGSPQDPAAYPNQAQLDIADPRYQAFINPASTLAGAQAAQIAALKVSFTATVRADVSYTSKGGITKDYQADMESVVSLMSLLWSFQAAEVTPPGFYWKSSDNTEVPFAYSDMQGLAAAMGVQGWPGFQKLQLKKAAVNAALSNAGVALVTW